MSQEFNHDSLMARYKDLIDEIASENPIKLSEAFFKRIDSEVSLIAQEYVNHQKAIPVEIRAFKKKMFYISHAKNQKEIVAILEAPIFYDPIKDAFALTYEYNL